MIFLCCEITVEPRFTFWASDFTCSFTWLLMTFVVNKLPKFGHLFSLTYCTSVHVRTTSRYFKFTLTYIFSFPFAVWKSNSLRFKMSKQKIWSDLTASSVVKEKKYLPEFQQARRNLLFSWKNGFYMVDLNLKKMKLMMQTLYNSLYGSVLTFSSQAPFIRLIKYNQAYAYCGRSRVHCLLLSLHD